MKFTIVGCSAKKHTDSAPAEQFYQGQLFQAAVKYCKTNGREWNILSAKQGLVLPHWRIHPYDLKISELTEAERYYLITRVRFALNSRVSFRDTLELLCGRDYCAVIEEAAAGRWQISRPMQGLGIGYQLQWLKANAKEAA